LILVHESHSTICTRSSLAVAQSFAGSSPEIKISTSASAVTSSQTYGHGAQHFSDFKPLKVTVGGGYAGTGGQNVLGASVAAVALYDRTLSKLEAEHLQYLLEEPPPSVPDSCYGLSAPLASVCVLMLSHTKVPCSYGTTAV
jgi:hypothetical protein